MMEEKGKAIDKYIVSQSNSLIEADYSQANLTARAMKIGRLLISKISPDDKDFRITKIPNHTIRQYLGYKAGVPYNRFNADLEDICKRLNEQVIRVRTQRGSVLNAFLISSWEIDLKKGETIFEISGRLKDFLLQLKKNYTTYQLENIPKLHSSYSIRMYELLSQYRRIGKRKFELEDLKSKLGCNYQMYGHFKDKALNKAQKELEKYTDLRFDFEELKKGRKVVGIVLYIYPNDPTVESRQGSLDFLKDAIALEDKFKLSDNTINRLNKCGLKREMIAKFVALGFGIIEDQVSKDQAKKRCKTLEVYYLEKLTLLAQSKTSDKNPAGFLIKALKEDWKKPKLFVEQRKSDRQKDLGKKKQNIALIKAKIRKLEIKLAAEKEDALRVLIADKEKFTVAYNQGMAKLVDSIRRDVKRKYSTPMEQYTKSAFLSSAVNIYLSETYPEQFQLYFLINENIKTLKKELEQLA